MASPTQAQQPPHKITVFISGNGSNLQALLDSSNTPSLPNTQIARVISDRKNAYGLQRAAAAGIPTTYHGVLPYKKQYLDARDPDAAFGAARHDVARRAYDADLARIVLADAPAVVVCAGFMRVLTTAFLDPLSSSNPPIPIINLHPSLHGDLVGAGCIQRAWEEFQAGNRTKTGVMVHYVIAEVDLGEVVVQREVGMEGCAGLEELEGRVRGVEHGLIVEGVRRVLEGATRRGGDV